MADRFFPTGSGADSAAPSAEATSRARRAVVASSVGNALEWFDIIVYSSFAVVISALFFPKLSGFRRADADLPHVRPVVPDPADRGGGDRQLRRPGRPEEGSVVHHPGDDRRHRPDGPGPALAPTAAAIGPVAAGVWLLVSRLVQGFSAGGEFGTATTYLVESAPHRKGFYGSWQVATQGAALFLASLFGYLLNTFLNHDALYSWGWRVPFLFGMLIVPVGYYIRSKMDETEEFVTSEKVRSPLAVTLTTHLPRLLTSAGIVALASISVYLILYMPTFAVKSLHLPGYAGYLGGIIAGLVTLACTPFVGTLADRVGAARVMTIAAVAAIVLAWPLFKVLHASPTVLTLTLVQIMFGILMAVLFRATARGVRRAVPHQCPDHRHGCRLQRGCARLRRVRRGDLHRAHRVDTQHHVPELLLHRGGDRLVGGCAVRSADVRVALKVPRVPGPSHLNTLDG
jgi:MHS family proline/betaine transporter-like MFS transporter